MQNFSDALQKVINKNKINCSTFESFLDGLAQVQYRHKTLINGITETLKAAVIEPSTTLATCPCCGSRVFLSFQSCHLCGTELFQVVDEVSTPAVVAPTEAKTEVKKETPKKETKKEEPKKDVKKEESKKEIKEESFEDDEDLSFLDEDVPVEPKKETKKEKKKVEAKTETKKETKKVEAKKEEFETDDIDGLLDDDNLFEDQDDFDFDDIDLD